MRVVSGVHTLPTLVVADHDVALAVGSTAVACLSGCVDAGLDCLDQFRSLPNRPVASCASNGLNLLQKGSLVPVESHLADLAVVVEADDVNKRESDNALVNHILVHAGEECAASIVELQSDFGFEAEAVAALDSVQDLLILLDDLLLLNLQVLDDSGGLGDRGGGCDVVDRSTGCEGCSAGRSEESLVCCRHCRNRNLCAGYLDSQRVFWW